MDLPHKVILHADEVRNAFSLWTDAASQQEYLAQIRWRIWMDFDTLPSPVSNEIYFPDDLVRIKPDDVFVDCGAYDGDTIRNLVHNQGDSLKKIIAFEPDPVNFQKLQRFALSLPIKYKKAIVIISTCNWSQKRKGAI